MIIAKKNQRGFVALISVIIISAVLLFLMVTAAAIAFRGRFNTLDYENKKISVGLAEACVQTAMLKLAQSESYNPADELVTVETGKICKIE
jgi:Tfp pilus assembly protein PilX